LAKRKSLTRQVQETLTEKLRTGQSKHKDKKAGTAKDGIYSYKTLKTYIEQCCYFTRYCKEKHGCRYLDECRKYANEYLQYGIDRGLSNYTLHLSRSALAKLYGESSTNFMELPPRKRQDIKRSRSEAVRDAHFSEKNNKDIVFFCKSTGLRRHELEQIRGRDYRKSGVNLFVTVRKGKGGKYRDVPVYIDNADKVLEIMQKVKPDGFVFPDVPENMDIHSYRAQFATDFYNRIARPVFRIPKKERYYCRKDRKGIILDKRAMLEVSKALGHNRISVIAEHYLLGVR
jgi:integrase